MIWGSFNGFSPEHRLASLANAGGRADTPQRGESENLQRPFLPAEMCTDGKAGSGTTPCFPSIRLAYSISEHF